MSKSPSSAPRDAWFRNATWSPEIEATFFRRLARARTTAGKAQYLRIQASHLQQAGIASLLDVALQLLDVLLDRHPAELQLAQAHLQRAECLSQLGREDEALAAFRLALDAERAFPNVRTHAWLGFGWLVVEQGLTDLYAEVTAVLDEFEPRSPVRLPAEDYELHGIRAVTLANQGDADGAKREARLAVQAASRCHSGLGKHPFLGLVRHGRSRTSAQLTRIVEGHLDA